MGRERAPGKDVPIVLTCVAIDGQAAHRRETRVRERAKAQVIEQLLARIATADRRAALGTRIGRRGRRV
jgi:hypothetical protein